MAHLGEISLSNLYATKPEHCKNDKWEQPFFNTKFSNGESFFDGNPIFSARNLSKGFLVKIIINEELQDDILNIESDFNSTPMYIYEIGLENIKKILR